MKKITFCINTAKNERNHLELLFHSFRANLSSLEHDFIVYVDNNHQNSIEYLKDQREKYFPNLRILPNPLPVPIGYARNVNLMFELAQTDIVTYLHSDMVVCKNYDLEILKHLDKDVIIGGTRIEPPLFAASSEKLIRNFGTDPATFNLKTFTDFAETVKKDMLTDFWFAPHTLYKSVWTDIGGHDTLYRRSWEDVDLIRRFAMNNIKIKQSWNAFVYHFTCTSSRGIKWWTEEAKQRTQMQGLAETIEHARFLRKWPVDTRSTFFDKEREHKYPVSVNFYGAMPGDNTILHNFFRFNKIYIDNPETRKSSRIEFENFHQPANMLLDFSPEQWQQYKKYYRTWDAKDVFVDEPIVDDDSILEMNLAGKPFGTHLNKYFETVNEIIHENKTETGQFMIDELNAKLTINRAVDRIRDNLIVHNPSIADLDLKLV